MINKGKNRVHEKVKDMRQNYSKAVVNGTRSGSGRIVYEHYAYDKLVSIWGGSANTEPLPYGVRSDDFEEGNTNKKVYDSDDNYDDDGENNSILNTTEITATDSANINNNINQNS